MPTASSDHTSLAVMTIDSILKKDGNYYPQTYLKECKYVEKVLIKHIIEDLELPFADSDESDEG